jgi:hypothetical protein
MVIQKLQARPIPLRDQEKRVIKKVEKERTPRMQRPAASSEKAI